MYISVLHKDFNPHNIIISEKTRNNVMVGSDFHRLIFSDEYCSTNGIYIHFSLTNITVEKYFNKIKCCFQNSPQNNATISSIKSILKISGIWVSNQSNEFGLTFRFFIFNNQF